MSLITKTAAFVKNELYGAEGGHDWFHTERVWRIAEHIGKAEGNVNMTIVTLGAILHDAADAKFHGGDEEIGPRTARQWLTGQDVDQGTIYKVENIVRHISFKGNLEGQRWISPELMVVQDADRLDALGAIGIARTFNYGGHKGRVLYDPAIPPNLKMTKAEYKASNTPTLNHFYEKLLLLKDLMNTETGRQMAEARHQFMLEYLEQFFVEWNGRA